MNQRGFTAVELTAVALIAGIMLSFTVPGIISYRASLRRIQACEQLVQDLRSARQCAVTQRTPVIVAFGNGTSTSDITTYTILTDFNGDLVSQSSERKTWHQLPVGTKLSYANLTPVDTLIFDISGILWPGTQGGSLIVASRAARETVQVAPTGIAYRL